jgi:hypothetical protein
LESNFAVSRIPTSMQYLKINQVKPNPNNPRIIRDDKFAKLVTSIQEFPQMLEKRPLVVNADMIVLGGNMRLRACKAAGLKEVPVIVADDWTEEQQRQFVIKDNLAMGSWDWDALANEFDTEVLNDWGLDIPGLDFDEAPEETEETAEATTGGDQEQKGSLVDQFGIPPFSVFDTRQGYWQSRKRAWLALGIQSELGRGGGLLMTAEQVTAENLNYYRNRNKAGGG